jgi:hypothetical protein
VAVRKAVPDEFVAGDEAALDEPPELPVPLEPPVDVLPQAAVTSATAARPAGTPHLISIVCLHSKWSAFTLLTHVEPDAFTVAPVRSLAGWSGGRLAPRDLRR